MKGLCCNNFKFSDNISRGVILVGSLLWSLSLAAQQNTQAGKEESTSKAAQAQGAAGSFETRKAEILANMETHLKRMDAHKTCVSAAKNDDELRACHEKHSPRAGMGPRGMGPYGPKGAAPGVKK